MHHLRKSTIDRRKKRLKMLRLRRFWPTLACTIPAVTVAPTAAEAGTDVVQRLSLVICIPVSYSVITIDRRIVNTLYVLAKNNIFWQTIKCFGKTLKFFGKTWSFLVKHIVFSSGGPVCWVHFWKDTNFLKNEISFTNMGYFKKIWNRTKSIFSCASVLPPPFSQSSNFRLVGQPIQICYIIQKKMRKKMPKIFHC
jgi:hypothetical protein